MASVNGNGNSNDSNDITFRKDFGMWWPCYDHKPEKCHDRVTKTVVDVDYATNKCKRRRTAIQAGGHAGVWPKHIAQSFNQVLTFEPDPFLFECLDRNTKLLDNIVPTRSALGATTGRIVMRSHISAGSWRVDATGDCNVPMVSIDDLLVKNCDCIILDVEGYEVEVLKGAQGTIERCLPVIYVEELVRSKEGIQAHMLEIGYELHVRVHSDAVYVPRKKK